LPTVIAAFSNRRRSQAITDMHSAAFMGVSAAVHFLSLSYSLSRTHSSPSHYFITTATHCFQQRKGKINFR
jgi:hypothetical protein